MGDAPGATSSSAGAEDTEALRALLTQCVHVRKRDEVTGSDDIFTKLNLARYRDAALNLKGRGLYSKLQTAVPPVLYDPPGWVLRLPAPGLVLETGLDHAPVHRACRRCLWFLNHCRQRAAFRACW